MESVSLLFDKNDYNWSQNLKRDPSQKSIPVWPFRVRRCVAAFRRPFRPPPRFPPLSSTTGHNIGSESYKIRQTVTLSDPSRTKSRKTMIRWQGVVVKGIEWGEKHTNAAHIIPNITGVTTASMLFLCLDCGDRMWHLSLTTRQRPRRRWWSLQWSGMQSIKSINLS
jgi:hypothetical protein